jgi:hypothetical protein
VRVLLPGFLDQGGALHCLDALSSLHSRELQVARSTDILYSNVISSPPTSIDPSHSIEVAGSCAPNGLAANDSADLLARLWAGGRSEGGDNGVTKRCEWV